jgi:RNA polymerase sigma-70 factor, ECF subfamily
MSLVVGDRERAQDVAQEALLRACVHWSKVRRADSPTAWLYRVAFNLAKSQFRRRTRGNRALQRVVGEAGRGPADGADATDAVAIRAAVAALPPRQGQALVLRYYADLSVAETARLMSCPEGTVKTLTSRAIDGLRREGLVERTPTTKVTTDD